GWRATEAEAPRVASRPTSKMPSPTATTSSGNVTSTPIGDASARATRIAVLWCVVSVTRFIHAIGGQLERGQKPAFATGRVEPDAGRTCPQVGRIVGRIGG